MSDSNGDARQNVDMVNRPPHYNRGGIEVVDVIEAYALDYHLGNVLKYICRAKYKGCELEDLQKARWYLDRAITRLEGNTGGE